MPQILVNLHPLINDTCPFIFMYVTWKNLDVLMLIDACTDLPAQEMIATFANADTDANECSIQLLDSAGYLSPSLIAYAWRPRVASFTTYRLSAGVWNHVYQDISRI